MWDETISESRKVRAAAMYGQEERSDVTPCGS
jgi:hypothetical protein